MLRAFSPALALALLPLGCLGLVVPTSSTPSSVFRRALLCDAADAEGVTEAGARLEEASGKLSVEYGTQSSIEDLGHNFTHIAVLSAPSAALLYTEAVENYYAELHRLCNRLPLDVRFAANKTLHQSSGWFLHFVIWRFDSAKVAEAQAKGQGNPVDIAVAGYSGLPESMPGYFTHLETAQVTSDSGGTRSFPLNADTIVVYSTFESKERQDAFAEDDRRKSFKAEFVTPYLDADGSLVFDVNAEMNV